MDSHRPGVTNFVHVGLVVEDLDETVRFLALLGFDCGEPGVFTGEWIDRIIGLENVTVEIVMARAPDGAIEGSSGRMELPPPPGLHRRLGLHAGSLGSCRTPRARPVLSNTRRTTP